MDNDNIDRSPTTVKAATDEAFRKFKLSENASIKNELATYHIYHFHGRIINKTSSIPTVKGDF
ncbi:MAG: hypothetical protein AAF959_01170 [Cyanobacteria bacterium P01_D01_bin.56]